MLKVSRSRLSKRGIPAIIVMPQTTPDIKVQAVKALGGEAVLHGDDYDSAFDHAMQLQRERNLVYVHAFDDPDVIAGQGTIGIEILRQGGRGSGCDFYSGRRWWSHRRHRGLREVSVSAHACNRR